MVRDFTSLAGWMRFERLDRLYTQTHVLAWRFRDDTGEAWTARVNAFKAKKPPAIAGAARVLAAAIPQLMEQCGWKASETALTAALSSVDSGCVPTKPLPMIGRAVAKRLDLQWLPDILTKQPHKPLHNIFDAAEREAEAAKALYQCGQITNVRRILVLDDLFTMGSTLNNIAVAINNTNNGLRVHPIGLGKSEKRSYALSLGKELTNEHVPASWATLWDTG